jgi:hypothetical protein
MRILFSFLFFSLLLFSACNHLQPKPPLQNNSDSTIVFTGDTMQIFLSRNCPDQNWGTMKADTTFKRWYTIHNDLGYDVNLERVMTGDGGCYPEYGDMKNVGYTPIKKGENFTFYLVMNAEGKQGKISRSILLRFSDASKKEWAKTFHWDGIIAK